MTRDFPPIVQRHNDLVAQELLVDVRQAALQVAGQLELDPYRKEDGGDVENQPPNSEAEQNKALEAGEEESNEDGKGEDNPDHKHPLVADVVESEAEVVDKQLHVLDVFFNSQLRNGRMNGKEQVKKNAVLTVRPWAISSSGTSSGRNFADVIHGNRVFTGSNVTITSPLAKPILVET